MLGVIQTKGRPITVPGLPLSKVVVFPGSTDVGLGIIFSLTQLSNTKHALIHVVSNGNLSSRGKKIKLLAHFCIIHMVTHGTSLKLTVVIQRVSNS